MWDRAYTESWMPAQQKAQGRRQGFAPWSPTAPLPPVRVAPAALPQEPPQDLLSLLLLPDAAAAAAVAGIGGAAALRPGMPQLQHLALVFPPQSVVPPTTQLPDALSTLTQVGIGRPWGCCALKLGCACRLWADNGRPTAAPAAPACAGGPLSMRMLVCCSVVCRHACGWPKICPGF